MRFRFIPPLLALISIPFVYNSCQKSKGFSANKAATAQCKTVMEKGVAKKLEFDPDAVPRAFENQKVRLSGDLSGAAAFSKTKANPVSLASGTDLAVLMDNKCVAENIQAVKASIIGGAALQTSQVLAQLSRQAYSMKLERDYTDVELEQQAMQEPCVVGVSWNRSYKMQFSTSAETYNFTSGVPGHLGVMQAQQAYQQIFRQTSGTGGLNVTGNPVVVAVVDSGVDWQHPDIQPNLWTHSNGVGIDITTLGPGKTVNYNPFDESAIGHGTHVAGLIAARYNPAAGVGGIMPYRGKIMAIKVFKRETDGTLSTTSEYIYNAIRFAYMNRAQVINLSIGSETPGPSTDTMTETAITEAVNAGSTVVTVIGNASSGNGKLVDGTTLTTTPGQFAAQVGVIGVGSVDAVSGAKSYFSHYSPVYAEIAAPGADQGSTGLLSTKPTAMSGYGRLAGTSQAGPLVSGAAGLVVGLIRESYGASPSPAEVERLMLKAASKDPALAAYFKDGNRLDMQLLVSTVQTEYPLTKTGGGSSAAQLCP